MSAVLAGAIVLALLALLSGALVGQASVSPRVAAGAHFVSLVSWGVVPTIWLACLGGSLGSWVVGTLAPYDGCAIGATPTALQLLGYVPAAASLVALTWKAAQAALMTRRAELRGMALARSARYVPAGGGAVWVVPSREPAAYAAGLWRPKAVVTSALLAKLGPAQRRAVCEHETAHVRLGHPRLLLVGGAVAALYGALRPVKRSWEGLRREIEAAADDEAARVVGPEVVVSALAQVTLGASADARDGGVAGFGEAEHLQYRIARLGQARRARALPTTLVGSLTAFAVAAIGWSTCGLTGARPTFVAVAACSSVVGLAALRPLWAWSLPRRVRRGPR